MEGKTEPWRITDAEFKGFVKASLNSINSQLKEKNKKDQDQDEKIVEIDKRLVKTEVRSTVWGSIAAVAISIASWFIR